MDVIFLKELKAECVIGVWDWERRDDTSPENWEKRLLGRRLLTAEVNAARD